MDGIIDRVLEDGVKRGQGKKEVVEKFLDINSTIGRQARNVPTKVVCQ